MTRATEISDFDDPDLSELDSLLNDPDVPMQADRVWELLAKVSAQSAQPTP